MNNRTRFMWPGIFATALIAFSGLMPAPGYAQEQAKPADGFVDFIGINIHLGYTRGPYGNFDAVRGALLSLGIRHIRDGGSPPLAQTFSGELKSLARSGIHTDFMLDGNWYPDGPGGYPNGYGKTPLDAQAVDSFFDSLAPAIDCIEEPNETNGNKSFVYLGKSFPEGTLDFNRDLYRAAKSSPTTRKIPVILSSVADMEGANSNVYSHMTAVSPGPTPYADLGNIHIYPGAEKPSYPGPWWPYSIDWQLNVERGTASSPGIAYGKPIDVTETGYEDYADQWHISDRAAGLYFPRLLFEYFNRGVHRCYIYELYDDTTQTGKEAFWGLMHSDNTPKPAYSAIKNLIGLLADPGPRFRLGKLTYTLSAPPTVHHCLLEKRDGSFYLVLWNEVDSYRSSVSGGSDIENPPVTGVLTLPIPRQISVYSPNDTTVRRPSSARTARITLQIPDAVTIVKIGGE